jgi:hypothetical protein
LVIIFFRFLGNLSRGLTETLNVVPVDLNSLMAQNFETMADLYGRALADKEYLFCVKKFEKNN